MHESAIFPRHDEIEQLVRTRNAAQRLGSVILASTDVLLPNGSKVLAVVEGGAHGDRVTVSDGGAALIAVSEAGLALDDSAYAHMKRTAQGLGLSLVEGVLRSEAVEPEQVSYAIVLLANGAREIAKGAFEIARKQARRRFRDRVEQDLGRIFEAATVQRSARMRGASDDVLRFDYLVTIDQSRRMVVDAPVPDGSSIAAVVLRHADIKAARVSGLHQVIIYDEGDRWPAPSLSQLQLAQVPLVSSRFLREGLLAAAV